MMEHIPQEGTLEPELFQYLLLILVSIAKARPSNMRLIISLVDDDKARLILAEREHITGDKVKI